MFLTQRGVKIRLPVEVAFTYIGRLYPKRKATDVFKTVEGMESINGLAVYIALFICLGANLSWIETLLSVSAFNIFYTISSIKGYLMRLYSNIGYFYSLIPFYLKPLTLVIFAYFMGGFMTVVFTIVIFLLSLIVAMATEFIYVHKIIKENLTAAEVMFFGACAYHSSKLGYDINQILRPITDNDISEGIWVEPFREFAANYPKSVDYRDVFRVDS